MPIPISRQQVARVCDTAAKLIDQKITTQALSYREVVGVFDEWTDNLARAYLGLTPHAIISTPDGKQDYRVTFIGHIPLLGLHITHEIIANTIKQRFIDMDIMLPDIFFSDAGSKCEQAIELLNATRMECWGHVLNRMLKDICKELKFRLPLVLEIRAHHGKSTVFQNFMQAQNAPRCTLPSYVETRFYSLGKLFHTTNQMFDLIDEY